MKHAQGGSTALSFPPSLEGSVRAVFVHRSPRDRSRNLAAFLRESSESTRRRRLDALVAYVRTSEYRHEVLGMVGEAELLDTSPSIVADLRTIAIALGELTHDSIDAAFEVVFRRIDAGSPHTRSQRQLLASKLLEVFDALSDRERVKLFGESPYVRLNLLDVFAIANKATPRGKLAMRIIDLMSDETLGHFFASSLGQQVISANPFTDALLANGTGHQSQRRKIVLLLAGAHGSISERLATTWQVGRAS